MAYTIVQLTTHLREGDAMYRQTWPMQALGSLPEFRVIAVHCMSPWHYQLAFDADLLVLDTITEPELVPILRWRKAKGKPTVFEVGDSFFQLDPWNPIFDLMKEHFWRAETTYLLGLADLVQTTTPFLMESFAPYCSRIVAFPNQLAETPKDIPPKPDRPLFVGWGGSFSHITDIARIAPVISEWVARHDHVVMSLMGHQEINSLFTLPPGKKRYALWGDMNAYQEFLRNAHIGLAPLRDTPHNRGRSDVKWLECAAHGCVFVGQRMAPYACSVEDGKTGFLFDDTAQLLRILDRLYQDRGLLESVRRAAFEQVVRNRRLEDHIHERAAVYMELLDREPPKGGESWNLRDLARLPHPKLPEPLPGYLPVTIEEDEKQVLEALFLRRRDLSEDSVRLVEERYGEFHRTCSARAVLALSRSDPSTADRHLQRSLSFYPAAVEDMIVHGKLLLAMGRPEEAKRRFSRAAQWYPAFIPAYIQLLNLLEQESRVSRDWEEVMAVADEWARHCHQDPRAPIRKGLALIRTGKRGEGMDQILGGMRRVQEQWGFWELPAAAELVRVLQKADSAMAGENRWSDLILEAAEMFPYGTWLAVQAGRICFERGNYEKGARILQAARERLLALEWQGMEQGAPQHYRVGIEIYRTACEELAQQSSRSATGA